MAKPEPHTDVLRRVSEGATRLPLLPGNQALQQKISLQLRRLTPLSPEPFYLPNRQRFSLHLNNTPEPAKSMTELAASA